MQLKPLPPAGYGRPCKYGRGVCWECVSENIPAATDAKKIKAVNDDLKGTGIKFNFSDGKGGFGGLENMYVQLSKLSKLTPEKQMATKKTCLAMIQKRCRRWIS
nr:Uncharacterised protein [Klebsiella pneumoniae]